MTPKLFETVGDYPSMLNKVALFTLGSAFVIIALLRVLIPEFDAPLSRLSFSVPIWGVSVPLGTFAPALAIAFLSRVTKLHDRLSDLFGIRKRFDVASILFPLCAGSGGVSDPLRLSNIKLNRASLMRSTFYKYASSGPGKAVIDSHYITLALDQWSWYWILLETCALVTITGVGLLSTGRFQLGAIFLLVTLIAIWLLQVVRGYCEKYALQQVEQILSDPARKREVLEKFNAL
jgi:hypothetical protein